MMFIGLRQGLCALPVLLAPALAAAVDRNVVAVTRLPDLGEAAKAAFGEGKAAGNPVTKFLGDEIEVVTAITSAVKQDATAVVGPEVAAGETATVGVSGLGVSSNPVPGVSTIQGYVYEGCRAAPAKTSDQRVGTKAPAPLSRPSV